jgi:PAS domain S-box-containing protein
MNVFALGSLLASATPVFLGTFVLYRNPREALNWYFFLYNIAGACASFAEFEYRQAESFDSALFWMRASFLWIFAIPLELHFVMHFTERTDLLGKKSTRPLLYVPALVLSILWLAGSMSIKPVPVYWGWTYLRPRQNVFMDLLVIYVATVSSYELLLCLQYYLRQAERQKKRQTALILTGFTITLILVLTTEPGGLCTYLKVQVPKLTSLGFITESALLAFAIRKYELFALTPATAAESIIATLADALFLVNPEGRIVTANQATLRLLGYQGYELINQPVDMIFAREESAASKLIQYEQLLTTGFIHDTETTLVTKEAKKIPVSLSASLVRDEQGVRQGVVYVGRDLTERKRVEDQIRASLREKETLLKEIHHRVKNNLQIVSSLLILQSETTRNEQALKALRESRDRVYSMAIVHEVLYQSQDLAQVDLTAYVQQLMSHLLRSYDTDARAITLKIDVARASLGIETAIYCGLIINELVSNALKHAFPAGRPGEIRIGFRSDGDRSTLTISDNGVGLPPGVEPGKTESLGLQLVTMLTEQLEGTLELDQSNGTAFKIVFGQQPTV